MSSTEHPAPNGAHRSRSRPLTDALMGFLFTPGTVTQGAPHVRDAISVQRMMVVVVFALVPATVMALYNTGLQANRALQDLKNDQIQGTGVLAVE